MALYRLTKFGADWLIIVDARVYTVKYSSFSNSRANKCSHSNPITAIIKLKQDLLVMYSLTKFGALWLIIVDARV